MHATGATGKGKHVVIVGATASALRQIKGKGGLVKSSSSLKEGGSGFCATTLPRKRVTARDLSQTDLE